MPLFRPVNRSDNVSCSNQQRTTAPAKIVVTKNKESDQKRSLDQCTYGVAGLKTSALLMRLCSWPVENKQQWMITHKVEVFSCLLRVCLKSCFQVVAKDWSQKESFDDQKNSSRRCNKLNEYTKRKFLKRAFQWTKNQGNPISQSKDMAMQRKMLGDLVLVDASMQQWKW